MPLFMRVSTTDWMEDTEIGRRLGSWDLESTIRLAKMLLDLGVDLLDRQAKKLLIGLVGEITGARQAQGLVHEVAGMANNDVIFVGRQFLRDGGWVLKVAEELGVEVAWPTQIARPQIQEQTIVSKM
ncbi:uncharacterized protein A1O5_13089 [Cladophialophora psammophila CBS 110553]|uniref:Uncharacterized protein n=1 Tax=Cladophialophora psammophila CBS 110553 TaxID=1182543 RepID=W9VDT7_9EURO|nr:uncharacterized protein A1O5_13089 [Cladophialophora psammophila CBS 110553]EXJ53638.1 hypothetical protein A1O5_13089 [Cladophialophora psammophila CBS 110553]